LLGGAVLFLMQRKPEAVTQTPVDPVANVPNVPAFDDVRLPTKTKDVPATEAAPVVGMSPTAPGEMPPYVYQQIPDYASYGAFESGPPPME
jgi:hypothetical protein